VLDGSNNVDSCKDGRCLLGLSLIFVPIKGVRFFLKTPILEGCMQIGIFKPNVRNSKTFIVLKLLHHGWSKHAPKKSIVDGLTDFVQ